MAPHHPSEHMTLIRVSLAELESRAGKRKPGYVEAFMSVARMEADGQHLLISEDALRQLWRTHTAPGLGDELLSQAGCCGE